MKELGAMNNMNKEVIIPFEKNGGYYIEIKKIKCKIFYEIIKRDFDITFSVIASLIKHIFVGDMSFVQSRSKRICCCDAFETFISRFSESLKAKTVLAGVAQVYGGIRISSEEKTLQDIANINKRSFMLDLEEFCINDTTVNNGRYGKR